MTCAVIPVRRIAEVPHCNRRLNQRRNLKLTSQRHASIPKAFDFVFKFYREAVIMLMARAGRSPPVATAWQAFVSGALHRLVSVQRGNYSQAAAAFAFGVQICTCYVSFQAHRAKSLPRFIAHQRRAAASAQSAFAVCSF